jgi:bifunctional DNA-binding transcriptional regulator/antitoxin component of YhaV-PrlF toxin-antitoxin module
MAATVTIPAEFRERFDAEIPDAVECVKDTENEYTGAEQSQADELVRRVRDCGGGGGLTVEASSVVLVALVGCVARTAEAIPSESPPNDPEVRRDAEKAIADLQRWYGIAAEIPEEVRG